jgi:hypothetical protein
MRKHMSHEERARWNEAGAWRVKGPPFHVRVFNFVRGLVVGTSITTLLLIATLAWLFIAIDIPGMLAAGIPDKDIPAHMTRQMGFAQWPQFLRGIGHVAGWGSLLLAAAVLVVARRNTYGLHILRGLVGVAVFSASLLLAVKALQGSWEQVAAANSDVQMIGGEAIIVAHHPGVVDVQRVHGNDDGERVASAVEQYLKGASTGKLPVAGGIALIGLVLMSWPARQARGMGDVLHAPAAPVVPPAVENN